MTREGNGISQSILACAALAAACLAGCADKGPAVFEKVAIDKLHTVAVLPLQSPQDSSAGAVASGMLLEHLAALRKPSLTPTEPPILWRLGEGTLSDRLSPLSDEQALRIAKDMGADAVLVGTMTYSVQLAAAGKMPADVERGPMKDLDFQRDFAARQATAAVSLQLLSVPDNRAVYAHSASANGEGGVQLLKDTTAAAIEPLERYLRQSRPGK